MEISVQLEKPSKISRKLTVKVGAKTVMARIERGFIEVQKTAKIKGFRPGHVPLSVVKQHYGSDVRHQVMHDLIDESYRQALKEQDVKAVSAPQIETPDHKTGTGAHDHEIKDGQDLTFTATVEVMPEIDLKGYTGFSLTKESVEVTEADIEVMLKQFQDSQAQLSPAAEGHVAVLKNFADVEFTGGVVVDGKVKAHEGMKGTRLLELGSGVFIPGFEEQIVGLKKGESKTFRITFPADYHDKEIAGKEAEFSVKVNELKEKKLAEITDEFAKSVGFDTVALLRERVQKHLSERKVADSERKLRSDLLQQLNDKNTFEVPAAMIQSQTRALAQDVAGNLKQQGFTEEMIQGALAQELEGLSKKAESQVRASLLLDEISKKEQITVSVDEIDAEIKKMAVSMQTEEQKIREFYVKNPGRKEDLEFRLREDKTVQFLLGKCKIK